MMFPSPNSPTSPNAARASASAFARRSKESSRRRAQPPTRSGRRPPQHAQDRNCRSCRRFSQDAGRTPHEWGCWSGKDHCSHELRQRGRDRSRLPRGRRHSCRCGNCGHGHWVFCGDARKAAPGETLLALPLFDMYRKRSRPDCGLSGRLQNANYLPLRFSADALRIRDHAVRIVYRAPHASNTSERNRFKGDV